MKVLTDSIDQQQRYVIYVKRQTMSSIQNTEIAEQKAVDAEDAMEIVDGTDLMETEEAIGGINKDTQNTRSQAQLLSQNLRNYRFHKRTPLRPPTGPHDIYVTTDRPLQSVLKRIINLLMKQKAPYVEVHALGAAISDAIDLSLVLTGELPLHHLKKSKDSTHHLSRRLRTRNSKDTNGSSIELTDSSPKGILPTVSPLNATFITSVRTDTVILIDDYLPLAEHLPLLSFQRRNSAIHIRISLNKS